MWWDHRTMSGLGKEKKDYNFFLPSSSRAVVKSGSSMPLGCGQSPLWVWFVGKCPISEGLAPHQLCVEPALFMDETNDSSLFPFENSGFFPTLKSDNPQRAKGQKNTLCEISQHSSFHMRAHCSLCLLELHLLRLWEPGPSETPKETLWEPCQGAGAAKFSFCQLWRKLHWWRSASLEGKLNLKMSVQAGSRQQMPEIRPAAQFGVSLPLRLIPQGSVVSPRTGTWGCFHRGQKWQEESNETQPQSAGAEWAAAEWFQPPHQAGFAHPDLKK